jgi:hypothetical protein
MYSAHVQWYASYPYPVAIRVPLKVVIAIEGGAESRTCEGETIVVNLHGALIKLQLG